MSDWTKYEHHFAQVQPDVKLHYVDIGPRDGTPVVLVHGWPDLWMGWRVSLLALCVQLAALSAVLTLRR